MNCKEAKSLLPALVDKEVRGEDRSRLESHLESCSACREVLEESRRQDAELRRAFGTRRQRAAALPNRVMERLPPLPPNPRSRFELHRPRAFLVAALAAAAAGFLAATLLFRPWEERVKEGPVVVEKEKITERAPEAPAATLALATSAGVEMLPPGADAWQPLATGGAILDETRLRTGPGTCVELRTADGSEVRLDAGTELLLRSPRRLELIAGRVWSSVEKADAPFTVLVPQAQATVTALGTKFDVLSKADEATVTVIEGSTRVEGERGEVDALFVKEGEQLKVVGGKPGTKEQVVDLVLQTKWVHELLVLKGKKKNPELEKRIDWLFAQIGQTKLSFFVEDDIRALGDHCVVPMTRYLQSEGSRGEPNKRLTAARILADLAQPWSIPDLIDLLADPEPEVRFHIATALRRLTRHGQGGSPEEAEKLSGKALEAFQGAWKTWWEKNQARYPKSPY